MDQSSSQEIAAEQPSARSSTDNQYGRETISSTYQQYGQETEAKKKKPASPPYEVEDEETSRACYGCGKTGHLFRDCPAPKSDGPICWKCKSVGHFARLCPLGKKYQRQEKMLLEEQQQLRRLEHQQQLPVMAMHHVPPQGMPPPSFSQQGQPWPPGPTVVYSHEPPPPAGPAHGAQYLVHQQYPLSPVSAPYPPSHQVYYTSGPSHAWPPPASYSTYTTSYGGPDSGPYMPQHYIPQYTTSLPPGHQPSAVATPSGRPPVWCYRCGNPNHLARNCTVPIPDLEKRPPGQ